MSALVKFAGVIPSAAAFQAEREPALSKVEGDLARAMTIPFLSDHFLTNCGLTW
jgi:hypothetical protein